MEDPVEKLAAAGLGASASFLSWAVSQPNRALINGSSAPISDIPVVEENSNLQLLKLSSAVKTILETLGEDPTREGLQKTPERFAKALLFLTKGYHEDPLSIVQNAIFHVDHHNLVLVKDIEFSSLCEHHLVPFLGKAHIGYIPNGRVVGLSKLARVLEVFARRLQIQEKLTTEVSQFLYNTLQPRGVMVVIESAHLCMVMRGVQKTTSSTTTISALGNMETNRDLKEDFWRALNRKEV